MLKMISKFSKVILANFIILTLVFTSIIPGKVQATGSVTDSWFTPGKVGLIVHWGMSTGSSLAGYNINPPYQTVADFEAATTNWDANYLVNEAKKMRAKYITFAPFHCGMGYLRAWHSNIPGTPRTNRDYLGELITAAHSQGIKVVVYMTTTLDHYLRYPANMQDSLADVQAYKNYKKAENPSLTDAQLEYSYNLRGPFGSAAFIADNIKELANNYAVDGFWFDAYNNPTWYPADQYPYANGGFDSGMKTWINFHYDAAAFSTYLGPRDIVQFVHNLNPNLVTYVNNFTPIIPADVISQETVGWGWQQGSSNIASLPTNREHTLIPTGTWWYEGPVAAVNMQTEVKKIVDNIGSGVNACIAEGPMIDGTFPQQTADYNNFLNTFFTWAGESLLSPAIAGGHGQGGLLGGDWSNGAYGKTTIVPGTGGSDVQYIHVLQKPTGLTLTIPNTKYAVTSAKNLKTGASLTFSQSGPNLAITVPDWNSLDADGDYIIKLTTTQIYEKMVNDDNTAISYSGWGYYSNRGIGDYMEDGHFSNTVGATCTYTFNGTGIDYISEKNSDMGSVDVYIDNVLKATVNLNNPVRLLQQDVYSITGLTAGSHTIKIVNKSTSYGSVDAFYVRPVNDDDTAVTYSSGWIDANNRDGGDYLNDGHFSNTVGATCTYTFNGTGIDYISEKANDMGPVDIYIDNVLKATVNLYNGTKLVQQNVYSITGLSSGSHTIQIVNKSTSYGCVDAFYVYPSVPTTVTVNDTDGSITYSSMSLSSNRGVGDYNNDVHYASANGAYFQYTFTGTGVDLITEKYSDEGNMDIYIDGVLQQTVNCSNTTRLVQQTVFSISGLASGSHTIKAVKKDGSYMLLDALRITQ